MKKLFGTDGIRGIANRWPVNGDIAFKVGQAVAYLFQNRNGKRKFGEKSISTIVIGKDTRRSSYMLEYSLASGICSMGANALLLGPIPTPGIAFLTTSMRADAGIVVSASHNTYEYNGIKIFSETGFKLPDSTEEEIEKIINSGVLEENLPYKDALGKAKRIDDALGRYIVFVKNVFPQDLSLQGLRIVIDCANGASYKVAPIIFEELGAEVIPISVNPNGTNINEKCGATYPPNMATAVTQYRADIGISLDGDADRVIMADENGDIVDGDEIMAICALQMKKEKTLHKNTVVSTPMTNIGMELALKNAGINLLRTDVGDRYVVEEMRKHKYSLGGEQSGHIIFLDHSTTGDGIIASLKILSILKKEGKLLSEMKKVMSRFPQILENVKVTTKEDFQKFPNIVSTIKDVETKLGNRGRVVVRYSGTEPLARIMVEGEDIGIITDCAHSIAEIIRKELT